MYFTSTVISGRVRSLFFKFSLFFSVILGDFVVCQVPIINSLGFWLEVHWMYTLFGGKVNFFKPLFLHYPGLRFFGFLFNLMWVLYTSSFSSYIFYSFIVNGALLFTEWLLLASRKFTDFIILNIFWLLVRVSSLQAYNLQILKFLPHPL